MNEPPDQVYRRHGPFLRELYRSIEEATALAVEDFNRRDREVEGYHLASYVRNETKARLAGLRGTSFECSFEYLSNNGIQVTREGASFRVRKRSPRPFGAKYGEPLPSQSAAMRRYWEQHPLALVFPGSNEVHYAGGGVNLFVLWEFDFATKSLASLDLVKPGLWRFEIPHPATEATGDDEGTQIEAYEDLEFDRDETLDEDIAVSGPDDGDDD